MYLYPIYREHTRHKCRTIITIQYNNIISYDVCWIPMEWDVCTPRVVGCVCFTGRATRPPPGANPKSSYNTVVGGLATLYATFELSCNSVRVRVHHYTIYPFSINTVTHPSSERLPSPSLYYYRRRHRRRRHRGKKYQNKTTGKPNDRTEPFRRGHRLRKIRKHGFLPTWQSLAQY